MSSLKERGRVKRAFAGLFSGLAVVSGMLDWPAGLVSAAWGRGVPCFPAAADPGEQAGRVKDRAEPGRLAGAVRRP